MSAKTAWSEKGKKETDFPFSLGQGKRAIFPISRLGKRLYIGNKFPYFLFPYPDGLSSLPEKRAQNRPLFPERKLIKPFSI